MGEVRFLFDKTKRYLTRGVNQELPLEIQIMLWNIIDEHVESEQKTDYLQVFRFEYKDDHFIITHSQEFPQYQKTYHMKMKDHYYPITKRKVYVIDDILSCVMLFSNEY